MAGGLERNILRVANHFARQGHSVVLLTFDRLGATAFYDVHEDIQWFKVGRTEPHTKITLRERFRLLSRIRSAIRQGSSDSTVVIAFHHGILIRLLASSLLLNTRVICSERNALSLYNHIRHDKWNLNFVMLFFVARITVQFERYRLDYPKLLQKKIVCIPNLVEKAPEVASPDAPAKNGRYHILAVGRLCDQKNYSCLLTAFAKLAEKHPLWDLKIVGNGDRSTLLADLASQLDIRERVIFTGATSDVTSLYSEAHVFCMPSKWEGFPNALAEAMAHGLPAVGFAECAGVCDLIKHDVSGLLASGNGNISSLSLCLEHLIESPEKRFVLGRNASLEMEHYSQDAVFSCWDRLLATD